MVGQACLQAEAGGFRGGRRGCGCSWAGGPSFPRCDPQPTLPQASLQLAPHMLWGPFRVCVRPGNSPEPGFRTQTIPGLAVEPLLPCPAGPSEREVTR